MSELCHHPCCVGEFLEAQITQLARGKAESWPQAPRSLLPRSGAQEDFLEEVSDYMNLSILHVVIKISDIFQIGNTMLVVYFLFSDLCMVKFTYFGV